MLDEKETRLEVERARGEIHERAWEQTVKPFFEEKEAELFDAFIDCPTSEKEMLMDLKLQLNVLKAMKIHFESYIDTGRMAATQLGDRNDH